MSSSELCSLIHHLLQSSIFFLPSLHQLITHSSAMTEQTNGSTVDQKHSSCSHSDETLHGVLHRLISMIIFPDTLSTPLLQRIKISVSENAPRLGDASRNTTQSLLDWTRRGSPLRALLVISVSPFLNPPPPFFF